MEKLVRKVFMKYQHYYFPVEKWNNMLHIVSDHDIQNCALLSLKIDAE